MSWKDSVQTSEASSRADLLTLSNTLEDMRRDTHGTRRKLKIVAPDGTSVPLPEAVVSALELVLGKLAEEDAVSVVGLAEELTT